MRAQMIHSEIPPRMAPGYGLPSGCKEIQQALAGGDSETPQVCRGTNGITIWASMLNAVHLMLYKAAGTAIPSFSSRLLEGGVSPEEEDVIMWTSRAAYLGTSGLPCFCPGIYIFLQVRQTRYIHLSVQSEHALINYEYR